MPYRIYYSTAAVTEGGIVHFVEDVDGLDRVLERACWITSKGAPLTAQADPAVHAFGATTPVDRLLLAFLAALGALAAVFVHLPSVLLEIAALAACILLAARVRARSRLLAFIHAFLPVAVLSALVNLMAPVVERANSSRWDVALAAIDTQSLGWLLPLWKNAGGRPDWLTDAASLAYASYYLLPVGAALALWMARRKQEFDRFVFALSVVLLASYAAYFIAPAAGPRVPDAIAQAELGGGRVSALLRAFLRVAEHNRFDAFPSGHTAVSLAFLAAAWPAFPRLRALFALAVAAIIFATVYLSLHYATDVIAGAALALAVLPAVPRIQAFLESPGLPSRAWFVDR
jgi:membrane-associated phospholipid phosphatase